MNITEHLNVHYEINKVFICSTMHISEETQEFIESCKTRGPLVVYDKSDFGHYIVADRVLGIENLGIPEDLKMLLRIAFAHDCYYLEIDSDGPEYSNLPTYDW